MITQTYILDLIPSGEPLVVHASQFDQEARTLAFDLYVGGVSFEMPAGASATIAGTKPDGTAFMYAMTVNGSVVSIPIELQMAAVYGDVDCEIQITESGGGVLGTANFILRVEKAALDESQISETDIPVFQQLVQQARTAAANAEDSATDAEDSATASAASASAAAALIPASGSDGDLLRKTATGTEWAAVSAGHTIEDGSGTAMTQRSNLQFIGGTVYDDATNAATVVEIPDASVGDLEVVITYASGTYTADHTYAEILANYQDGGTPRVWYNNAVYQLRTLNPNSSPAVFVNASASSAQYFYIYASGSVTYTSQAMTASWTATVAASSWTNGEATIASSNITASNVILLGYPATTSDTDYEIIRAADIRVTAQAQSSITIKAQGTVPTSDITLQLTRWL